MSSRDRLSRWDDMSPQSQREALDQARAGALALLAAHIPADDKEARDLHRIQSLIVAHPNIFSSSCGVGHITASAAIVELASRRTLLHYHKRLGRWLQVGGHLDGEADIAQAARREAREETGLPDLRFYPVADLPVPIDIDVHCIPQSGDKAEHLHLDFRYILVTSQPDALAPAPGESTRLRWLGFTDALALDEQVDASLHRLLRKARDLFVDRVN